MQPGISTHVFFQHRLRPGLLDALAAAGARNGGSLTGQAMTIEVFAARHHFDYTDSESVREIAAWFRSNDVRAVLHQPIYIAGRTGASDAGGPAQWSRHVAPDLDLLAREKSHRIAAMDEVKRALEAAEQVPFAAIVIHLGLKDAPSDEPAIEHSLTAIEHLKAFAAPLGVRLLLENLRNEIATPENLLAILRAGHFDSVGICLDVGHLHLAMPANYASRDSGVAAAIDLLGPRIAQVHLHDNRGAFSHNAALGNNAAFGNNGVLGNAGTLNNNGVLGNAVDSRDEHLWPGTGSIDWSAISASLAALPAATPGILEIASDRDHSSEDVARLAEAAFQMFRDTQPARTVRNP